MQWHKRSEGKYVLSLPGKESVTITSDLLGKFAVTGVISGTKLHEESFTSLPDALSHAESNVALRGKEMMTLLRRESKWHKGAVTEPQMKMLKRFKVPDHIIVKMTKGDAAKFITRELGKKGKK